MRALCAPGRSGLAPVGPKRARPGQPDRAGPRSAGSSTSLPRGKHAQPSSLPRSSISLPNCPTVPSSCATVRGGVYARRCVCEKVYARRCVCEEACMRKGVCEQACMRGGVYAKRCVSEGPAGSAHDSMTHSTTALQDHVDGMQVSMTVHNDI
jgi:hypothetical protein